MLHGIVWQPDYAHLDISGRWHELGIRRLLVQWTAVDDWAFFVPGIRPPEPPPMPDWNRIAGEPWAEEVILGLAGRFSESDARARAKQLVALSERLAAVQLPINVVGWYFPAEIDPTWTDAHKLGPLFASLPERLWVSVYDRKAVGAHTLADTLAWLPQNVGVFFQDGVGEHVRNVETAREYADVLADRLGRERLKVIVEAFRPHPQATEERPFRAATADELVSQVRAYEGHELYLFDGPHWVSDQLVGELKERLGIP